MTSVEAILRHGCLSWQSQGWLEAFYEYRVDDSWSIAALFFKSLIDSLGCFKGCDPFDAFPICSDAAEQRITVYFEGLRLRHAPPSMGEA